MRIGKEELKNLRDELEKMTDFIAVMEKGEQAQLY